MLAFSKVIQPKTVAEAYEAAVKNKMAPLLASGCWIRLGRRIWPVVIDLSEIGLRYVKEENNEFVIGAMATQSDVEQFEPLRQFVKGIIGLGNGISITVMVGMAMADENILAFNILWFCFFPSVAS